jgi:hypothetical protein
VVGLNFIPGNVLGNAFLKNEMASPLTSWCKFRLSVIVRKKVLKALAIISSFIRRYGISSVRCNFPVSCLLYSRLFLSDYLVLL